MKKWLTIFILLAGVVFEWQGNGENTSVYYLRLTRLNLTTLTTNTSYDYQTTGVCAINVTDFCSKFYSFDMTASGLLCRVGGYKKLANGAWAWMGWSRPVVLDIWGDFEQLCETGTGTLTYNLPYPTVR